MAAHRTPGVTFLVESHRREDAGLPMSTQKRPQQLPQTYRGPRGVTLTDEQDQNEDSWSSDSRSGSEDHPNETLRKRVEVRHDINLGRLRNRQRQSRQAQLKDQGNFGEGANSAGTSNFNPQTSHAGGQAVLYGQNGGYFPQPNPFSAEPLTHYATNHYPTSPYLANPYSSNPYPTNNYPTNPRYHAGRYPTNPYPASPYPTSPYDQYAATHYPPNPYAPDPAFVPSQGAHRKFKPEPTVKRPPYSADSDVDKVKRELKDLKMEEAARLHQEKDRRRADEYLRKKEEQATLEKESKRTFEKLKKRKHLEAKAQQRITVQTKRGALNVADGEEISDVIKRCVEKETREALERMAAGRQVEGKLRLEPISREREKERLLVKLVDFVDERRRQDGRSRDGGSVRDSLGERYNSRMQLAPSEFVVPTGRAPDLMRREIEDIVLEVLQRRSPETEVQQTPFSDKQTFSSVRYDERPPLRTLPPRSYVSEPYDTDEGLRRSWEWERRGYSFKGTDPAAYDRTYELLFPSHTTVSDRYAPPVSNGSVNSPQTSPTFRHESTRKVGSRKSHPPQSRATREGNRSYTCVPGLHDVPEQPTRDTGDDGFLFPSNTQRKEPTNRPNRPTIDDTVQAAAISVRGMPRSQLNADSRSSKRVETAAHPVNEEEYTSSSEYDAQDPPPTWSSKHTRYTYTPRKVSSSNRLVLNKSIPPAAPDPPQA